MIVICGQPSVGNGRVYVKDGDEVYVMEHCQVAPRPEQTLTMDGRILDSPEWWFESVTERSH